MRDLLLRYSEISRKPSPLVRLVTRLFATTPIIGRYGRLASLSRFFDTNSLAIDGDKKISSLNSPSIEVLFVCAAKDFELLQEALNFALLATRSHDLIKVSLIVPDSDVERAKLIEVGPDRSIDVLPESKYLSTMQLGAIRDKFGVRSGWVIQQLLKVLHVSKSDSPGVLVCDADTLLLRSRIWFDKNFNQILTPTWEITKSYYVFLSKYGLVDLKPLYTFVSHHMLMQPHFMREARDFMSWKNTDLMIDDLIQFYDGSDPSPFSIDFELYAQYLMKRHPDKVVLAKWANKAFSRRLASPMNLISLDFASISLHDYL